MAGTLFVNDPVGQQGGALPPPTAEDLDVRQFSPTQWRVLDKRIAADDGLSILGFIEVTKGQFEAMEIGHGCGFAWYTFDCLADKVAHFARAFVATQSNPEEIRGDSPWNGEKQ